MISMSFSKGSIVSFNYQGGTKKGCRTVTVEKCDDRKQLLTGLENGVWRSFTYAKMGQIRQNTKIIQQKVLKSIEHDGNHSVAITLVKDGFQYKVRFFCDGSDASVNGLYNKKVIPAILKVI